MRSSIFTVKIVTDLACAQRRYPYNTSGLRRQCWASPQRTHLPIYANLLWFSVSFAKLRRSGPVYNFCPSHLPFGDACIFPLSLSYDPLPPQNLASHNLVSRRQSVVVLTVKMVHDLPLNQHLYSRHRSRSCIPNKSQSTIKQFLTPKKFSNVENGKERINI